MTCDWRLSTLAASRDPALVKSTAAAMLAAQPAVDEDNLRALLELALRRILARLAVGEGKDEDDGWAFWMHWPDRSILKAWLKRPTLDGVHVIWTPNAGKAKTFAIDFHGRGYITRDGEVFGPRGTIVRPSRRIG